MASSSWKPADKGRVTRNPYDDTKFDHYAPNFSTLKIYLDGKLINNKHVRDADIKGGFLNMFKIDDYGKVISTTNYPEVIRFEGVVTVEGIVSGCSPCALGKRKVHGWWSKW